MPQDGLNGVKSSDENEDERLGRHANGKQIEDGQQEVEEPVDTSFTLTIELPRGGTEVRLIVAPHEQVHEIRQSIIELPTALQYSCFHLESASKERINDFVQIAEITGLKEKPTLRLVEDPYTEKEARIHFVRVRELIGAAGDRTDSLQGALGGTSLFDDVAAGAEDSLPSQEYDFAAVPNICGLLPRLNDPAPKTIKAISLSPWNPPPAAFRQKGHLLYILVTTNEGEQFQITSSVGGFFVNKCSNIKFDPFPKTLPKAHSSHSLLTLLEQISTSFLSSFRSLQEYNGRKDPLATFQLGNAIPAASWIVPSSSSPLAAHNPDATRAQETYLMAGVENTETLRDWNEEFQSARELPRESVQDRVFRERLIMKLFADYNDSAARGAIMVARGEVTPLNPTETPDAQIFVYNNVFYSFGADGVGTYAAQGGDEAARVAAGKDVSGVKVINNLDIEGLHTPCTVVVDYLGKRIVAQSIVPGIFKQPEPGETQIQYGAVDGLDVVAADERFVPLFRKLADSMHIKKHPVWDKEHKRFDLESSVEMKGLVGTDGRRYVLDLYRITPLDISWQEGKTPDDGPDYPHRMSVLRQELVESYRKEKLRQWVAAEVAKRANGGKRPTQHSNAETSTGLATQQTNGEAPQQSKDAQNSETHAPVHGTPANNDGQDLDKSVAQGEADVKKENVDLTEFRFALNPDVFSGHEPQTEAEKAQFEEDEREVRAACTYLLEGVIPGLLKELKDGDIGFPVDGRSLTRLIHKRGINIRYIGRLAALAEADESGRLDCVQAICIREMVSRSFKHVASSYLRHLPLPLISVCVSHLLNCLLGAAYNTKPIAELDEVMRSLYADADFAFEKTTPESLRAEVEKETLRRYRYTLNAAWYSKLQHRQLLREICLKLGIQLQARDYLFVAEPEANSPIENGASHDKPVAIGVQNLVNGEQSTNKKRRRKARDGSPASTASSATTPIAPPQTFTPDDVVSLVPVVRDSSPRSILAEEALEAGRISLLQDQKKIGQELLLESLSLYEQIYGLLHPEVAQVYYSMSQLYATLGEKELAVDLAHKAIIVAERTVGVDSGEVILDYLNLSLLTYQGGDSKAAIVYAKHALDLWKSIYGPSHPDTITAINNGAVILQQLKAYHESRRWFEEALRVCEMHFGRQYVGSATLLFQLAQALALDQDSKGAVNRMRESYNIFLAELGPNDKNTKEAESWLEQLTQNAVSIARHAKDVQARRLRASYRFTPSSLRVGRTSALENGGTNGTAAAAAANNNDMSPGQAPAIDSRSIDELIQFIEGGDIKHKGQGKPRPGRNNPKARRAGAKTVSTSA
jgi:protein TIF31